MGGRCMAILGSKRSLYTRNRSVTSDRLMWNHAHREWASAGWRW